MIYRIQIGTIVCSLVLLLLAGCGKAYTGDEDRGGDDPSRPLDEDIPVMLAISDPVYSMITRGSGAFDAELGNASEMWKKAVFYIYAFKAEEGTDYSLKSCDNTEHCLVDGSVDTEGTKMGKKARLNGDRASYLSWIGSSSIFYDSQNPIRPYRFFGFYIDDLEIPQSDIERTSDAVKLKLRIDGTQDIMSTVATLTDEQKDLIKVMDDRAQVMQCLYSAYAARVGIHPVLAFHHQLARVKFKIFPANEKAKDIYVESVSVESKTEGVFTVASKDQASIGIDFSGSDRVEALPLCEIGAENLKQDYYKVSLIPEEAGKEVYDRTGVVVGESLLLAPGMDVYKMKLRLKQILNGIPSWYDCYYDLQVKGKFQAGMQYTVRVAVNGLEDANVDVVVDGWRDGGSVDLNPDDDWMNTRNK